MLLKIAQAQYQHWEVVLGRASVQWEVRQKAY
jgi:hypothetical protein